MSIAMTLDAKPAGVIPAMNAKGALVAGENLLVALALAALALLPVAEILLRAVFHFGIPGAATLTQHLVLVAGILGAAIAARENRLLSLSSLPLILRGWTRAVARALSGCVGALVSALLAVASTQFVITEKLAGNLLVEGLPVWVVQAILPPGFALIAVRLILHAGNGLRIRATCAAVALCAAVLAAYGPLPAEALRFPALIALLGATILGAPVFTTLAGAALILFWSDGLPIASIPIDLYRLTVNPSLPAIPLFTLAGYFLAEGGAPARLVAVFKALVGGLPGGSVIVVVATSMLFTAFTGASGVTILALGGLLMPLLLATRRDEGRALGIITGAGSLGVLLPPSLPLILYAVVARVPMEDLFLAALLPALLIAAFLAAFAARHEARSTAARFDAVQAWRAISAAKWELALPVVAVVALFGGFATPVEAAALTATYAFVVVVMRRELHIVRDVPRVVAECGLLVGGVLLILGVALGFTNYLVDAQLPDRMVEWATGTIESRWVFLLALNGFLLVVGCLMDVFSAIVVVAPLLIPVGLAFGIDPLHLGVIFLANMELGFLTPPVGMNLFFASYRFGKPVAEVCRAVVPYFLVMAIGVIAITYLPALTTWLPAKFHG
jgi:tripartite ATP-independent transporter DctM subunit